MKKRILSMLCILVLMLPIIALPASAATTAKLIPTNIPKAFPVVKQDPKFTLVNFWTSMTGANGATVDQIVNWFNSTIGKQKKIYVKGIFQGGYDDIAVKVQATIQSNNLGALPDLALLAPQGAFSLKESKYIVYLDDLIAADKTFTIKDKLNKNAVNACSYKGRMLGLPFANSALVLHYNVPAFKAAGLDPDNPPKTFDELASAVTKLVIKGKGAKPARYGLTYKLDGTNLATWITRMNGGKGTSFAFDFEDGRTGSPTKLVCAENGTLKSVLTAWKKVTDTGAVDYRTASGTSPFQSGGTAMFISSMVSYPTVEAYFKGSPTKKFEHRMTRLPSVSADDGVASHVGGSAMYMFNRGDNVKKAATWEFVKFLASVDVASFWAVQSGYFALNNDAVNTKYLQDFWAKDPNTKSIYKIREESVMNVKAQAPMIPNSSSYVNVVADQATLYVDGKATVDQAVTNIAKKVNSILKTWHDAND